MYWGAFPLFVIAYAWLKHDMGDPGLPPGLVRRALFIGTLGVAIVVVGLTLLATAGHALLPAIMRGNNYTPAMISVVLTVTKRDRDPDPVDAAPALHTGLVANGRDVRLVL